MRVEQRGLASEILRIRHSKSSRVVATRDNKPIRRTHLVNLALIELLLLYVVRDALKRLRGLCRLLIRVIDPVESVRRSPSRGRPA